MRYTYKNLYEIKKEMAYYIIFHCISKHISKYISKVKYILVY